MPLTRWLISSRTTQGTAMRDATVNTLYFNVSLEPAGSVGWDSLGNDLWTLWTARAWAKGRYIDVRGYNMDDAKPREPHFHKEGAVTGSTPSGVPQVALCLSYYADRNLPKRRGRIYVGPWGTGFPNASDAQMTELMLLPPALAGLGGLDVDWSIYSPTDNAHYRIDNAWCDDSWDIIRHRKLAAIAQRKRWSGNG